MTANSVAARMEGMTLEDLLVTYGFRRPADLAHALDIDRRYAWQLWHRKRPFPVRLALQLYDMTGIPLHELLRAPAGPSRVPKGRPPKRPPDAPEERA